MYDGYEQKDEVVQLYLDDIIPNRFQPREVFDETALKELAVSIKEHGVIQPIIVRNVNGKYEIIAGERRYKASALAGLTKIPAIIRNLDDKESSKVALLENLQRRNLNPIEEARTYQKILELDQMTQEELAKTMGKSQSSVSNKLRLLSLPEEIQDAILKERISERHARALLNINDPIVQKQLVDKIISTKMSVRALEEEIQQMKGKDASEIPIDTNLNASTSGFLDTTPLTPTAGAVQEEVSNYGKVVIAPPKEMQDEMNQPDPQPELLKEEKEEEIPTSRFVNYGEIGKDDNMNVGFSGVELPNTAQTINVDQVRQNATDIKRTPSAGAALDNLLNIQQPVTNPISIEEKKQKEDYFSLPSISAMKIDDENLPPSAQTTPPVIANPVIPVSNMPEMPDLTPPMEANVTGSVAVLPTIVSPEEGYTSQDATQKLKELIVDLKDHGVKITADEMNFPTSYQVIIKIEK